MRDFRTVLDLLAFLPLVASSVASAGAGPASASVAAGNGSATVAELKRLLPPNHELWEAVAEDRVFTRDTVAEYAGNGAEILLGFPFRLLLVREYRRETDGGALTVEVHDMATSGDAFGIFCHGPSGERPDVGQEAILSGKSLRFWKGNIFVRITGAAEASDTRAVLVGFGRRIAAAITRTGARPRILACLPTEGLNRASVCYFHKQVSLDPHYYLADRSALYLDETTDVALAQYPAAGKKTLLLVIRYASPQNADRAFRRFGGDFFPIKIGPATRRIVEEIGPGDAAAASRTGEFLIFVLEAPDKPAAEALLRRTESRIAEVDGPGRQ